jgi:hypothetical protein
MSVLDDEANWCKVQIEQLRRERSEGEYTCDCWVICTNICNEKRKKNRLENLAKNGQEEN